MIQKVTIDGKDVNLRFGMHCMEKVAVLHEQGTTGTNFLASLIHFAHENYCLGADEPAAITKGQAFNFVDTAYSTKDEKALEIIKVISAAFANSQALKVAPDKNEGDKKK